MTPPKGYRYISLAETGSTNDEALQRALAGGDNWIVVSKIQSAGRGRMGHFFSSDPGGLYMSMTWRPGGNIEKTPELTAVAGLAVRAAIAELCGVTPEVKPPNDLLINGKKVCGILTEARDGDDFVMVFGIGVNLTNTLPPELSAIAGNLRDLAGTAPDPDVLAERIAERLMEALS
ncbi:MAG: biotin--[acetyl-CoA-carboxylase] ligase [Clostridia bacterium]|nr:biotin--[acetyl-CoA-carboxylase] ligase [Clostridia bacterium]